MRGAAVGRPSALRCLTRSGDSLVVNGFAIATNAAAAALRQPRPRPRLTYLGRPASAGAPSFD